MKRIWITKEGRRVLIRRMETSHIVNCVRLLERYQEARIANLSACGNMLHGEIAQADFDFHFEQILEEGFGEDDPMEQYLDTFRAELLRRGHEIPDRHDIP
jgi:hypothetical protein